jgi:hypothetical protein
LHSTAAVVGTMYGFEAMTFNVTGGFLEAIVRGYRAGLLTAADYNNLCQCETLEDVKLHLSATDYGPYLANGTFLQLTYLLLRNEGLVWSLGSILNRICAFLFSFYEVTFTSDDNLEVDEWL